MTDLFQASGATFSVDNRYRYRLWRQWDADAGRLLAIMLNPSTADAEKNDPTIERLVRRAMKRKAMGKPAIGSIGVINLFAFRATEPEDMKKAADPIGPENDEHIIRALGEQRDHPDNLTICGWGQHGTHLRRDLGVRDLISESGIVAYAFKTTKNGQPVHPLYQPYDAPLIRY